MASIQAYQSHGIRHHRIVESYRKEGKPAIRFLAHLGKVDDILRTHRQQDQPAGMSPLVLIVPFRYLAIRKSATA